MRSRQRFLTPVMTARQRRVFVVLVLAWLGSLVFFWRWWLQSAHVATPLGMLANSAMFVWSLLTPGVFFVHLARMARTDPALELPRLRVAMIVTKAPSEPWEVVRRTLRAMLRQQMPYPYDVWLADEAPTGDVRRWCEANGVHLSSREGRWDYHREEWPRRTRSKEGNLAFFYDSWGYGQYDVVAQLDSDHRPTPHYLENVVRPFIDSRVGYVAAPSIDDANARACWVVRGRFFKEAVFHGPHQAGAHHRVPPICIGSHYAVRTRALRDLGGLGPELAEDLSTSLMMNAFGWHGVFAMDAEAHGDGPETFADLITQEFQWARSVSDLTLRYARRYWPGLGIIEKLKLGFVQSWYPLYGLFMLTATLFPVIALWTGSPWAKVRLFDFFSHVFVVSAVLIVTVDWIGRQGWLRPSDAPTVSWEAALYMFTRWPWILFGVVQSWAGWLTRRRFGFKVTPKNIEDATPIRLSVIAPYLLICAVCSLTAVLQDHPGAARGYYYFCLLDAVLYLFVASAVVVLHLRENDALSRQGSWRLARQPITAICCLGLLAAVAIHLRGLLAVRALLPVAVWNFTTRLAHELARRVTPRGTHQAPAWLMLGVGMVLLVEGLAFATTFRARASDRDGRGDQLIHLVLFGLLAFDSFAFVVLALSWQRGDIITETDFAAVLGVGVVGGLLIAARRHPQLSTHLDLVPATPAPAPRERLPVSARSPEDPSILVPPIPPRRRARRKQQREYDPAMTAVGPRLRRTTTRLMADLEPFEPARREPSQVEAEITVSDLAGETPFALHHVGAGAADGRKRLPRERPRQSGVEAPPRTPEISRAHALLYDRLVLEGWRANGRGRPWYAHRFRPIDDAVITEQDPPGSA